MQLQATKMCQNAVDFTGYLTHVEVTYLRMTQKIICIHGYFDHNEGWKQLSSHDSLWYHCIWLFMRLPCSSSTTGHTDRCSRLKPCSGTIWILLWSAKRPQTITLPLASQGKGHLLLVLAIQSHAGYQSYGTGPHKCWQVAGSEVSTVQPDFMRCDIPL